MWTKRDLKSEPWEIQFEEEIETNSMREFSTFLLWSNSRKTGKERTLKKEEVDGFLKN